ncbi:DUF6766 family protein [Arthrobacter sp. 4R501]|uniref:DUF6766 family protein n=1 Tax=Arthrobacter sp. 4R501 TaxID=2058886 RepID=UPI0028006C9B|nr:DUF6766 family protein [Arthrobacter sp. 4R501]
MEATFENWESEFLQMAMYVILTVFLFQKGSSESKPVGKAAPQDQDPRDATISKAAPWPVKRGLVLKLHEHSLSLLRPGPGRRVPRHPPPKQLAQRRPGALAVGAAYCRGAGFRRLPEPGW